MAEPAPSPYPRDWWAAQRLRHNLRMLGAAPLSLASLLAVGWLFEDRLP